MSGAMDGHQQSHVCIRPRQDTPGMWNSPNTPKIQRPRCPDWWKRVNKNGIDLIGSSKRLYLKMGWHWKGGKSIVLSRKHSVSKAVTLVYFYTLWEIKFKFLGGTTPVYHHAPTNRIQRQIVFVSVHTHQSSTIEYRLPWGLLHLLGCSILG